MAIDRKKTKREIQLLEDRTVATIYSRPGRPIINLVTGREPHPVGHVVCVKAGMKALVWESMKAEKPMIELCEVASPVHRMMTQPHELAMKVVARTRRLRYRPDLELEVDRRFADEIDRGIPFAVAVADWRPSGRDADPVTMIVEVKDDADPRIDDAEYLLKLQLAKKVYSSIGWRFITVVRSRDIEMPDISKAVRSMAMDHDTAISPIDISDVADMISAGQGPTTLQAVIEKLGGGHVGRAKAAALHVRRIVSIELRHALAAHTPVRLIEDGRAIFELPGRHPW